MKYFTLLVLLLSSTLIGCGKQSSSWVMSEQEGPDSHSLYDDPPEYELAPKVEILFVVDNSASMRNHINKVSNNISQFIDAFAHKNPLEFRLAVTSVYDSDTFHSQTYKDIFSSSENTYTVGQFRNVKKSATEIIPDKYFISSEDENYKELLKHTLKLDVLELKDGGPQFEEAFSPVAALYSPSTLRSEYRGTKKKNALLSNTHKNFRFRSDSYKVVFFITDASDVSNISPGDLYKQLVIASGNDHSKVMAFGAIVPTNVNNCKRDPGDMPYIIEEFLGQARINTESSNVVSLCGDFGKKFADFGKSIRNRTLSRVIKIKRGIPVINDNPEETLRVFYGNIEIFFEISPEIIGYTYDPRTRSIHINPALELVPQPGAKIRVVYTEADPRFIQ